MAYCSECRIYLNQQVTYFSSNNFGLPLCIEHQNWVKYMSNYTTQETIRLYFALKNRGVPACLEHFDGFKHIDISIPDAKVNIEVDGGHHNFNSIQALSDLKRTYFSFLKGYYTIRVPNSLVYEEHILEETADYIVAFLNESVRKKYYKNKNY